MARPLMARHGARLCRLLAPVAVVLVVTACGGIAQPPPPPTVAPTPAVAPPTSQLPPTAVLPLAPCLNGRLLVGDLLAIEAEWQAGAAAAAERARQWQADARLVQLRIGCQPLAADFRWQGTFYSDSAQSYFFSDTGQTEPAEDDPGTIPTLPTDGLSFQQLHLALARAGQADTDAFNPASGVTVRLNTPASPFGPPGIPEAVVYYVAVDLPGETRDLFVSQADWSIYSYRSGG